MSAADRAIADLTEKVRSYGWALVGVGSGEGEPPFTYTVGLTPQYGHCELVIIGLAPKMAGVILNDMGKIIRDGGSYKEGQRPTGLVANEIPVELVAVTREKARANLKMARRLNNNTAVSALQVVWADKERRLPWENGYDMPPAAQPVWGEPVG